MIETNTQQKTQYMERLQKIAKISIVFGTFIANICILFAMLLCFGAYGYNLVSLFILWVIAWTFETMIGVLFLNDPRRLMKLLWLYLCCAIGGFTIGFAISGLSSGVALMLIVICILTIVSWTPARYIIDDALESIQRKNWEKSEL